MIKQALQRKSGRLLAVCRCLLAEVFMVAVLLPGEPVRTNEAAMITSLYLALSLVYLILTWRDWWLERRFGGIMHGLDLIFFAALVLIGGGHTSPFFNFSFFLVLSATIRWSWREAGLTAVLCVLLFLLASLADLAGGARDFDLQPFVTRGGHLLVLSLIIVWLGLHHNEISARLAGFSVPSGVRGDEEQPMRLILEYVAAQLGAGRVVFALWEREEPQIAVDILAGGRIENHRLGVNGLSDIVDPALPDRPFLFDLPRQRILIPGGDTKQASSWPGAIGHDFAARFGIETGVRIPVRSETAAGEIFAMQVPALSSDEIELGEHIGLYASDQIKRSALLAASEETAAVRERLAFARDLHDSVVQFMAGLSMRLEGVRKTAHAGAGLDAEIDALQKELKSEQRDLRGFIEALRGGKGLDQMTNLSQRLSSLTARLSSQWGISCSLSTNPPLIQAPAELHQEIELIVREAMANAVRHGKASRMTFELERAGDRLELRMSDNGKGFPAHGDFDDQALKQRRVGPWSLHERVIKRGGTLHLRTGAEGTALTVSLPTGDA